MRNINNGVLPTTPYEKNETMRLLGYQCLGETILYNKEARNQIDDIRSARPHSFTIEAAVDIFSLGFIHGKRAERARRKDGASNGK